MLDNVAIDVVIGLVFVYLLYSLYATIIMEIISSSFGLRAKNLNYAIKRMLRDEKEYKDQRGRKIASRLLTSFLQTFGRATNLQESQVSKEFFKRPNIKYLGSGRILNNPSYLSAENFSKGIIDSIKKDDPDISMLARIELGLEEQLKDCPETKKQIQSLLDDANNDIVKFKILIEQWYNDTMERATGWFKRSTQIILLLIGFIIAIGFNVDTIAIIKKLSKDKDARAQLVQMATKFSSENEDLIAAIRNKKMVSDTVKALQKQMDSLLAIRQTLAEDISNAQHILAADWDDTFKELKLENTLRNKLGHVFSLRHFWGYLFTVLALSLGAPFWFDLLNKLVKLRSSKAITSSDAGNSSGGSSVSSNRTILNRAG